MIIPIEYNTENLAEVIKYSVGNPTHDKLHNVLSSYNNYQNQLIGYFVEQTLVACLGYYIENNILTIRHISVLPFYQKRNIGTKLINYLKNLEVAIIRAETDNDSVKFYEKLQFICTCIVRNNKISRYECVYIQPSPLVL
ncbi:MAG: GNAT family N-acetyltransferase [Rickettsiaceae bacterium]|nr:GNAT family N-acetyltransferase [Rickettsiaceae bacterium]